MKSEHKENFYLSFPFPFFNDFFHDCRGDVAIFMLMKQDLVKL